VLVIDDEAAVQEGMAILLRKWRCDVLTAGSGVEMKNKLVEIARLPDLIVSDYRLRGGENGIQVVEIKTIVHSAGVEALPYDIPSRAAAMGGTRRQRRPSRTVTILQTVKHCLLHRSDGCRTRNSPGSAPLTAAGPARSAADRPHLDPI
jgi:CheY-like chemotaxis protein